MQDQLVQHIVTRIAPHIREEELRRAMRQRPDSMTAYDRTLRALRLMDYLDKDMFGQARDVLRQAMEDDPNFAMPVAWSVWWYSWLRVGPGSSSDPADDFVAARDLAQRAIALDPNNALGLAMMAHLRSFLMHDYDAALLFLLVPSRLELPGNAIVVAMHALTLAYLGRGDEAVRGANQAIRLSPLDHRMFLFHNILALANFAAGDYEEAARWARASDNASPQFTANIRTLIASLAAVGANQEARIAVARLLKLEPNFNLARYGADVAAVSRARRPRSISCVAPFGGIARVTATRFAIAFPPLQSPPDNQRPRTPAMLTRRWDKQHLPSRHVTVGPGARALSLEHLCLPPERKQNHRIC